MTDRIVHLPRRPVGASDLRGAAPRAAGRVPLSLRAPRSRRRHDADQAHRRAARHAPRSPHQSQTSSPLQTLARAGYVRLSTPRIADDVDLIHSAQFMLRNPPKPYVVDFEQVGVFSLYQQLALTRPWARERLRRAILDERCRHLLPWSDAARDGLLQRRRRQRRAQGDDACGPAIRPAGQHARRRAATARCACCSSAPRSTRRAAWRRSAPPTRAENVQLDVISYVPDDFDVAGGRDRPRARPPRPGRAPVRPVPRAAVPEPHGHVRLGRDGGDGATACR